MIKQPSERSPRNKTLVLTDEDRENFVSKILTADHLLNLQNITNKLICGDTSLLIDKLPKDFIDLLIIDPPYNLFKNYHGNKFKEISDNEYFEYLESWFLSLLPLLKPKASMYMCCDWKSSSAVFRLLNKHAIIQNRITWQRDKGRGSKNNWKNSMEDIWFASMNKDYYFNVDAVKIKKKVIAPYRQDGIPKDWEETSDGKFRLTYPSNFWDDISIPYWSMSENTEHPTQKPEKLIAKLILASSKSGDFVFDPFLGSGTTAVVAQKLGRKFSGIEQNLEYCLWAQKRLYFACHSTKIQGYDNVFLERNSSS
ncbi:MAG: DNA-methyltransferase [Brevinema sp.]